MLRIAIAAAPLALSGVVFAQAGSGPSGASAGSGGGGTNPDVDVGGTADTHPQRGTRERASQPSAPPSGSARDRSSSPASGRTPAIERGNPPSDRAPGGPPDSASAPR